MLLVVIRMCSLSCVDAIVCGATRSILQAPLTETHIVTSNVTLSPKLYETSLPHVQANGPRSAGEPYWDSSRSQSGDAALNSQRGVLTEAIDSAGLAATSFTKQRSRETGIPNRFSRRHLQAQGVQSGSPRIRVTGPTTVSPRLTMRARVFRSSQLICARPPGWVCQSPR